MIKAGLKESPFFEKWKPKFDIWGGLSADKGFRECQLGAYWAVWAHFTTSNQPALVSLPTGAGKTALMMALSFAFKAKRVLIVTPATVLRDQTQQEFESLEVLKQIGVLAATVPPPKVFSNDKKLGTKIAWLALEPYSVITATPKTISPNEKGVCKPPDDLFDLIFIDEAHHTPAPTWTSILEVFDSARRILLTATPFRRDRRRIRASLVYHYSIGRALEKEIYRPIKYHPVEGGDNRATRDKALCAAAKKLLLHEAKIGNQSKLLIRSDRVEWANHLVHLYEQEGLRVRAVDYEKSWEENKVTIQDVRDGNLDGLVCVGMLGEGLDLPELKIAVLHSTPRSLPFTLQFVGRISRIAKHQVGEAHLIAIPKEVQGAVRRLYASDASWRKLVPKMVEEAVDKEHKIETLRTGDTFEDLDIDIKDIKPFFSARLYTIKRDQVDLTALVDLPEAIGISFRENEENLLVVITATDFEPPWAKETGLLEMHHDLHIYYLREDVGLMFELTTADNIACHIRQSIAGNNAIAIDAEKLMRTMRDAQAGNYYMVGLRNAIGRSPAQPSYKTLMGAEVQASVRPTDGKVFAPGHALVQLASEETRGVGTRGSRVWSIRRDNLSELKAWCDKITNDIRLAPSVLGLPQLSFLIAPKVIDKLQERPLAVILGDEILRANRDINSSDGIKADIIPYINIKTFKNEIMQCEFCFHSDKPSIEIQHSLDTTKIWKRAGERDLRIHLEWSDTDRFEGGLVDYLDKYQPKLVMPKGGVVIGREYWVPDISTRLLPDDCLKPQIWTRCEITKEAGKAKTGHMNIHEWVEQQLKNSISPEAILIKDHGKGELADYVVVEPRKPIKQIDFYHCKGAHAKAPSDRVKDGYEVLSQACRSSGWIFSPRLMSEMVLRNKDRNFFAILQGAKSKLDRLAADFKCNDWKYRIIVVQPGFSCRKIDHRSEVMPLLLSTYEWLRAFEADFVVWGSK